MERRNIPCDRAYGRRKRTGEVIDEANKILTVATARSAPNLSRHYVNYYHRRALAMRVYDKGSSQTRVN